MKGNKAENAAVKRILNAVGSLGGTHTTVKIEPSAEDLVRILSDLALQVQQFDAMVRSQRVLLMKQATEAAPTDALRIRRRSKRITARAAEVATRARGALDELRELSHATDARSVDVFEPDEELQAG